MWEKTIEYAKKMQPVSTTGMFAHTFYWLTSPTGDLTYANPHYNRKLKEQETAIYFIHGTCDMPAAFQRFSERLLQIGMPHEISSMILLAFDQRYHGKSIEYFAQQLREKIKEYKHQRVILVAHSRGGLVASYFKEFLAELAGIEVLLVFPISSPFNGSYLAIKPLSWFSDSVKEMGIDSEFLDILKKKILSKSDNKYRFYIVEEDAIVPGEAGYIKEYVEKNPESLKVLDRHGHLSVMSSHRLVSEIATEIAALFPPMEVKVTKLGELNIIDDYLAENPSPCK